MLAFDINIILKMCNISPQKVKIKKNANKKCRSSVKRSADPSRLAKMLRVV